MRVCVLWMHIHINLSLRTVITRKNGISTVIARSSGITWSPRSTYSIRCISRNSFSFFCHPPSRSSPFKRASTCCGDHVFYERNALLRGTVTRGLKIHDTNEKRVFNVRAINLSINIYCLCTEEESVALFIRPLFFCQRGQTADDPRDSMSARSKKPSRLVPF